MHGVNIKIAKTFHFGKRSKFGFKINIVGTFFDLRYLYIRLFWQLNKIASDIVE